MKSSGHIVNTPEDALDHVFAALSDRTRRAILFRLADGPARMGELAAPFDMSLPAVGKHVKVLEQAGLVQRRINGRVHICSLDAQNLRDAATWLSFYRTFWAESLDGLADYVEASDPDERSV